MLVEQLGYSAPPNAVINIRLDSKARGESFGPFFFLAARKSLTNQAMPRPRAIGLLLALATLLAYLPATHDRFINYDDDNYITQNQVVQRGLTWAGVKWAFTTWHASNWHPLTWLSHMTDYELFHLNPGGHHFVNVLFHAANATLLFLLLLNLTDALWPSAVIAALFAWHPLHVESVAWVSERKDVLSTFFALLALLAYVRYAQCATSARDPAPARSRFTFHVSRFYWLALACFTLGLMSKPMPVTLPFVMLLLDYWPLGRIADCGHRLSSPARDLSELRIAVSKNTPVPAAQGSTLNRVLLEKWPFFLLAALSSTVTFLAQRNEAVASLAKVPLTLRFENAILAYAGYLSKTIWPVHLAVFYPLSRHIAWSLTATAAAVLILISAAAWLERRRSPWLLVGWLWFLGTLVPVIGLVQVGDQAMADRYGYFPLIGIFIAITFTVAKWTNRPRFPKIACAIAVVLILSACLVLTEKQLRYWQDSESLFAHALAVTKDNALAHLNLGAALDEQNKPEEALIEYQKALQLDPRRHEMYNNIGKLLNDRGKPEAALNYCRESARLNPKSPFSHNNLGLILMGLGRFDEAMGQFSEAAQLDANYAPPRFQMGRILLKQGHDAEAMPHFHDALRIEPDNFQMLIYIARVLAADENQQIRNGAEALVLATQASHLAGKAQSVAMDTLAMAYAETGRFDQAVQTGQEAVNLARAAGQKDDAAIMQQRLELYQKRQPWRESFRKN
jgi:tetratricopeptide (TPR) repeat protein